MEFLVGKSILITGATGFLAKVLVEKILRTQPDIKKLYLLIRANDSLSAIKRFNTEVMDTELFRVVKEQYGEKFKALVEDKVFPVAGDISFKDLGIENVEQLLGELDIIINSAATTVFDERYDVAMSINTMGATNVLNFAKKCHNLKMIVHVSTAYFRAQNATEKQIRVAMKILGIQRAKLHGWPNTYSFTKAMGEMLLLKFKQNLCVIMLRPTIITSTYKEPFPGWIEGARTMDIFVLMYGKGRSNFMMGDPDSKLDAVLKLLNAILFQYFDEKCATVEKNISFVIRIAELYKPYLFFHGSFDDTNTKRLRVATTQTRMTHIVNCDPSCIHWEDYFINTHIPGVVKYAF
ncbi:unnamed protein product [Cuscuta europaea]|uniref:Fatty acyl-CoA reductase n=1 Tax=Cuscuta europaea TaxID=41803 RepID=A0A9P0ZAU7_CUSEU|nr:unnamed protein product [Cuscuta europaea]